MASSTHTHTHNGLLLLLHSLLHPDHPPPLQAHPLLLCSFLGLRRLPLKPYNPTSLAITTRNNKHLPARRKPGAARAALEPTLVISLSTGLSLFLGRFVFFNFQHENVAK
ncbi:photosystem I reaction center subunit V, chloroplastic [Iris pallida]|uniref:Photosystem I reaction center subunit V, chloroplastic n=1 Tax=Iris pallida TaxID=29817 RepID=A0AAX6FPP7_IRIPA|nr:photosystem I reaction center subunit V, chloroplastic [Iris pallida]